MVKEIKVVDVVSNEVNEEPEPSVNEVNNDEIQDVNEPDPVVELEATQPISEIEETPKLKAKAKAKPRLKKKTVAPLDCPPGGKIVEEVTPEVVPPQETTTNKITKTTELVKCEKCNKMMSQKSLRYTHEKNCKGQEVDINEVPVKRRTKKNNNNIENTDKKEVIKKIYTSPSTDDIPEEVKKEISRVIARSQLRMKLKEDNLNKLKSQIF